VISDEGVVGKQIEKRDKKTYSGPIIVMKITNAATQPIRRP